MTAMLPASTTVTACAEVDCTPPAWQAISGQTAGWLLCVLLIGWALRGCGRQGGCGMRHTGFVAMAGGALAVGLTLFVHSGVSLPEIMIALPVGGAAGIALARYVGDAMLDHWRVVGPGLTGCSAVLTAGAAWYDPAAFGLASHAVQTGCSTVGYGDIVCQVAQTLPPATAGSLMISALFGAFAMGGMATTSTDRPDRLPVRQAACCGWAVAAMGFAMGHVAMVTLGGLMGAWSSARYLRHGPASPAATSRRRSGAKRGGLPG